MQKKTTCPYCGVGCGLDVGLGEGISTPLVMADKSHPANFGRICSKGSALSETVDKERAPKRLTHPMVDGQVISWDGATAEIAKRLQQTIDKYGPDSVAFYLSGQLLTEDYYVANKLAKGFLGTSNVDTNSRLCMSSAVAAYKRAFGSDTVPCCYEDLELADLIVLIGSNTAWTHPVLYQRIVQAKESNPNMKVILIDPRRTVTADIADLHLAITPSSDNFLFQGLLNYLMQSGHLDEAFIAESTENFERVADSVKYADMGAVSKSCGVEKSDLERFFSLFANTKKTISFYSQGINQSSSGTDKCNSIINCHLATGKIGYEGAGPFSITGQPNAMGGREVGGLSNMLAAHMDFDDASIDRVKRFWRAPTMAETPGLKAVDLFQAIHDDKVKLVWIMATNPAVSLPDSESVVAALKRCETVIVSDITDNDTTEFADILLPAEGWSEKDGTVTNSERRISRQRGFVKADGVAKPDWWALTQVAEKLGFGEHFNYKLAADIFREHARLSSFENDGTRDFDLSGLANVSDDDYERLSPIQWPVNSSNPLGSQRMFTDRKFFTQSGKARFVASKASLADAVKVISENSLVLNTGRLRDQWHTMTRTGSAPKLTSHDDVAFIELNPSDAMKFGLKHHAIARVFNALGEVSLQVKIDDSIDSGQAFMPIHWNRKYAKASTANTLVRPNVDPISGQPEFKASNVSVLPLMHRYWVRMVSKRPFNSLEKYDFWSLNQFEGGWVALLGFDETTDWRAELASDAGSYSETSKNIEVLEYRNSLKDRYVAATYAGNNIETLLFQGGCASDLPSRAWMTESFMSSSALDTAMLVRGESDGRDELVCSCFGITHKRIRSAIDEGAKSSVDLAQTCGAGSKCGSCKPELNHYFSKSK